MLLYHHLITRAQRCNPHSIMKDIAATQPINQIATKNMRRFDVEIQKRHWASDGWLV